jgi:hypothetical protein
VETVLAEAVEAAHHIQPQETAPLRSRAEAAQRLATQPILTGVPPATAALALQEQTASSSFPGRSTLFMHQSKEMYKEFQERIRFL